MACGTIQLRFFKQGTVLTYAFKAKPKDTLTLPLQVSLAYFIIPQGDHCTLYAIIHMLNQDIFNISYPK